MCPDPAADWRQVREASLGARVSSQPLTLSILFFSNQHQSSEVAYVDSGAAGNFISLEAVRRLRVPVISLDTPRLIASVDGRPLQDAISLVTEEVEIQIGALHREKIAFYVLPNLSYAFLLGLPWLRLHEPTLNWRTGDVLRWGPSCHDRCLRSVCPVSRTQPAEVPDGLPSPYWSYADVFNKREAENLPPHRSYDCPVELLPGRSPPRGRIYPLSAAETKSMSEYIQENLAKGFIRKSSSPAGAGITIKNRYPLPLIPELFDRLRGARIFTKLDLRGAYNLVRIRSGDEWKTAFNTRDGHYEYLVMPFGLCNAPAVFQEFVNDVFRDLLYSCVLVYLDDILIFSSDLPSHRRSVREVLQRLRENHLYAKIEKCLFEQTSLPFLGYIVSDSGLKMDPEKVNAIINWPRPCGVKAIQRFIGFANYYRQFIPHFSSMIRPLSSLTRKGSCSKDWSPEAEKSFVLLKRSFSSAPVLHHPEVNKPFILEVDASSTGAGAVLSQKTPEGLTAPCGFFSKAFSPSERNYTIGDRELLAIKLALGEWRYLLEGSVHPFVIFSDHKNLTYLQTAQRLNPRQARWSLFFARFEFELRFRPGNKNIRADALSRSFQSPLQDAISLITEEVEIQIGALHREKIAFYVLPNLSYAFLLGLPWLRLHEPTLNWRTGDVLRWGPSCHDRCLRSVCPVSRTQPAEVPDGLPSPYWSYADVFNKREAENLPPHRSYDCPVELLPGRSPPRGRIYPLSAAETKSMSEYIQENLAKGFIRKSSSPAGAGITIKNRYPLPLIPELFDRLRGARIFTKLDLRGAYNLVRIRSGDEWKTAFNTRDGHYEYLVMPFGLCNAPAVFQEFVNDVFRDLLYSCVLVYLDDILIFSSDLPSHRRSVREVLQRLRENHLYAKIEKCLFEQTSLPFLGYIVSDSGLKMDPEKVNAIINWPRPCGVKAIQRFIGFANYYRQFIPHFSSMIRPLSSLTRKGSCSKDWSPEAEKSFVLLKRSFSSAPVLHHPEVNKPFILEVDASSTGAGAVLSQKTPEGLTAPCGFFSKAFSPSERNYTIGDRELLAIKLALGEWRYLLEGSVHPFVIFSDHKNLTYLQTAQRLNPRQARWSLFFARFEFELRFRPGNKNIRADALSRSFQSKSFSKSLFNFSNASGVRSSFIAI
ncbi:uncharacterized protein LOC143794136 [Ranitomeya variabilis]|uniref:uncharacterized protein LOC143794136 n=1 Tax=Ranitomeya variabilis TaxID=490064 RepID=UPI004057A68A